MKFHPIACALLAAGLALPASAASLVISQAYGGGGNTGATLKHDFVELFNPGSTAVSLTGWSLQYASASGTSWQVTALSGSVGPGQYYLVQQAPGSGGTQALPAADAIGTIAMGASGGKLALVSHGAALSCAGACAGTAGVVDFLGYGSANNAEGSAATGASNTLALQRKAGGCTDTNNNATDFSSASPAPRKSASATLVCGDGGGDGGSGGGGGGGAPSARIRDIQGNAHRSPLLGQDVANVPGIVTAVVANGFYMQDEQVDNDLRTSEGILVYTASAPNVAVGDSVTVSGKVAEFRPGGSGGSNNLSITEITTPTVTRISSGNALPAPVVIGNGGRLPPGKSIYSTGSGDVETLGALKPADNGLDFLESIEGMRVQLNNPVVSGPTNQFGDMPVLADGGSWAATRTTRGGIVIASDDFNPERLIVTKGAVPTPSANVGDRFSRITAVVDYSFGNYKLLATELSGFASGGLAPEVTRRQSANELAIASFNVENLSAADPVAKFDRLAGQIVSNLQSPDVIGLMEIQDNNGPTDNGVVDASATFAQLIAAIGRAGGPAYQHRSIDPANNQDGGQPGGNIRVGFLFNPARMSFVDRAGGSASSGLGLINTADGIALSASPGRIDPANSAFASSRKPLAAEFRFNDHKLFLIANHWNSKGGDQPLYGRFQPPQRSSELQRNQQAAVVSSFVKSILSAEPAANVVVLGDLNDFEFSGAVGQLKAVGMTDLVETLPAAERYTYVFEGNSQALDHILVSPALAARTEYDVVHVNSEFADQSSDHEPEVARLNLAPKAVNLSSNFTWYATGLSYNRATGLYTGTLTLLAKAAVAAPLAMALGDLPAGVTLANATTSVGGKPAIRINTPLAAGQSFAVPVHFRNSGSAKIGYTVHVFGGL